MKVVIYSPVPEISQIIAKHLIYAGHKCVIFENLEDLSSLIRNLKKGPDLIILDYLSFNHDLFNVYSYLNELKKPIPVIFYNDPCLTRSSRSAHWKAVLQMTHTGYFKTGLDSYDDIFLKIETLVESDVLSPYIPLFQTPKPVPENLVRECSTIQIMRDNNDDFIHSFKIRNHIPNNLYYLLSLLQQNKNRALGLNRIIEFYRQDGKRITERSLKVLISNLKNIIRHDKECGFIIDQDKGTYRFVRLGN